MVRLEGSYGAFFDRSWRDRGQLWLGGGIGITPFVSGTRALLQASSVPGSPVCLFYLAHDAERAYYFNEIARAAEEVAWMDVTPHYFSREGPLTLDFLAEHCPDFAEREVYMCGPAEMQHHLRRVLRSGGVPHARIHSEEFSLL